MDYVAHMIRNITTTKQYFRDFQACIIFEGQFERFKVDCT